MAQLVVRDLDNDVKDRLRRLAEKNGRSMEAEVRAILRQAALSQPHTAEPLGTRIAKRFRTAALPQEILELRGQRARAATFEK